MKLLLADDHTLFRDALTQYIERSSPDAQVTVAKDFSEVMDHMKDNPDQDLVLLDLRMPGMNGMQGFCNVRTHYPETPVALMSGVAEPQDVDAAMNLGAMGYFPKTLSATDLLQGIHKVIAGEKFIPLDHKTKNFMPSYYQDNAQAAAAGAEENQELTSREKEVLSYVSRGVSNKEIAVALGIQVVTVKLHVRGICHKLGVKNRTQAAVKAYKLGLVSFSNA